MTDRLLCCGGKGKKSEARCKKLKGSSGSGLASALTQMETKAGSLLHAAKIAALWFPLALQRGFTSVAGRGDARRAGVRVDSWQGQGMNPTIGRDPQV